VTTSARVRGLQVQASTDSAAVRTANDATFEVEMGDLVVPWHRPVPRDAGDRVVLDLVTMVAVNGGARDAGDGWHALLRSWSTSGTCAVKTGEHQFGYHAKVVAESAAILTPVLDANEMTERPRLGGP